MWIETKGIRKQHSFIEVTLHARVWIETEIVSDKRIVVLLFTFIDCICFFKVLYLHFFGDYYAGDCECTSNIANKCNRFIEN